MTGSIRDGLASWPQDSASYYRARGHWRGRPLGSLVATWARTYGSRVSVVDERGQLSYQELAACVDVLAERLVGIGVRRGESIIVALPNCLEFVVLALACLRAGVVPTMMLPAHREHELGLIAGHVKARAIAVGDQRDGYDHQALAARVAESCKSLDHVLVAGGTVRRGNLLLGDLMRPDSAEEKRRDRLDALAPDSQDVAVFLLSGGTTGLPKVIARTHDDYEYTARCSARLCRFGPDTVYLVALPASHTFPLACPGILGTLINGGRVVMVSSPRPEVVFSAIARERVTVAAAVPAVAQRWIEAYEPADWDLSSLRLLQVGGARPSPELASRVGPTLGCELQQVYGMSEGLLNYTRLGDPPEIVVATQGRPLSPDDEICIVDERGEPVADGDPGELLARGPSTIRGYFRAAEHTARCFTADGWYRTGDVVRRHPSGNLIVDGRLKDIINRGGEKISAEEIEHILHSLAQVARAAVVAAPDPRLGESVCACVVLAPDQSLTLGEIHTAFNARGVATYKIPERLEIMDALPQTPVGKINKQRLRELIAAAEQRSGPPVAS